MAAMTELHRSLIEGLCAGADIQSQGFAQAHASLCKEVGTNIPAPRFLPDAFRFNRATSEIEIYEVEVSNALSASKIKLLGCYWESWDAEGETDWTPVLIVVNRYGGHTRLDLCDAAYNSGPFANL